MDPSVLETDEVPFDHMACHSRERRSSARSRADNDDGDALESQQSAESTDQGQLRAGEAKTIGRIIRTFTPSWFAVNMGTGIVSILLHQLPYNANWLYWISVGIFGLNVVLFVLFLFISILRYTLYPKIWSAMMHHPVQSLFLGAFPMALGTIINMIVYVCVPVWGPWALTFAWALWWIDSVIALATCIYMPFAIMYIHETMLSSMTAIWLLPIVSTIVSSATGSIIANVLPNPDHALWTIITSYVLWGTGVPLAMVVLVLYFHRLTVHHLPAREAIVSVFLPLGPLGQGGYAIMQLGSDAMKVFPKTHTLSPAAGEILYVLGFVLALIMFGFGLVWLSFALFSISRSRFPFNMGWWGLTFPLGVFAVSTCTFGKELPSRFFDILGTFFSLAVVILWICVGTVTIRKCITWEIFDAPCLQGEGKETRTESRSQSEKHV
ncbi:MAG: hypothetical protein M4579_005755 [Chaenotheca gracillima]|nr:MAG: hypothetical protein M4579_005755 [Chaenotheca gracillima]